MPASPLRLLAAVLRHLRQGGISGLVRGVSEWRRWNRYRVPPVPELRATGALEWFRTTDANGPYQVWARTHLDLSSSQRASLTREVQQLSPHFRFVVLLLESSTDASATESSRQSVGDQVYPAAEVVDVDSHPGSLAREREDAWLVFLHTGDRLTPRALFEAARYLASEQKEGRPLPDLIYSDEDRLAPDGVTGYAPFFKPDFSADLLDAIPYAACPPFVRSSILADLLDANNPEPDALEYDLVVRATEHGKRVAHISHVLYRRHRQSDSAALKRVLEASLTRRGSVAATVQEDTVSPGTFHVRYPLPEPAPLVSVIIPFRDRPDLLKRCVESLLALTDYPHYELILLDNGSQDQEVQALCDHWAALEPRVRVLRHDVPFNYSAINNYAARQARGEYLVLLNNDTEIIDGGWMGTMLRQCARPGVGAVGATLLYGDGKTIQHAGVVMGLTDTAGHIWAGLYEDEVPHGLHRYTREVSAVTAACLMTPRSVWEQLNGLDERFIVTGNDVDYCLRARTAGLRILQVGEARLLHHESQSRDPGVALPQDLEEQARSYRPFLGRTDPFYNPNLSAATTAALLRDPREPGEPLPPLPTRYITEE